MEFQERNINLILANLRIEHFYYYIGSNFFRTRDFLPPFQVHTCKRPLPKLWNVWPAIRLIYIYIYVYLCVYVYSYMYIDPIWILDIHTERDYIFANLFLSHYSMHRYTDLQ